MTTTFGPRFQYAIMNMKFSSVTVARPSKSSKSSKSCVLLYSLHSLWLGGMDLWPSVFNAVKLCVAEQECLSEDYCDSYSLYITKLSRDPREGGTFMLRTKHFHRPFPDLFCHSFYFILFYSQQIVIVA